MEDTAHQLLAENCHCPAELETQVLVRGRVVTQCGNCGKVLDILADKPPLKARTAKAYTTLKKPALKWVRYFSFDGWTFRHLALCLTIIAAVVGGTLAT